MTFPDTPNEQRVAAALRKFRELQRDLLRLRHGRDWETHQRAGSDLLDDADEQEKDMLEIIGKFAEGAWTPPKS
jgi:hypothetical protein